MLTPFPNWINDLEEWLTCMFISITAWLCTKCMSHKSNIWVTPQCNINPKKPQPSSTGKSHVLSCCPPVSKTLCSLSCARPVSLAVLIKHISGRWLQLKDRFTDDTVQKDEKRFNHRGRRAGMPLALCTEYHKIDTSLPREAGNATHSTLSSVSCIQNISAMVK